MQIPKYLQEEIKKYSLENGNLVISLKDSGVLLCNESNQILNLIPTFQSKQLYSFLSQDDFKANTNIVEYFRNEISNRLGISRVENLDINRFSWFKEYTLDDDSKVYINSHGVSYKDEFFTFQEFLENHKDKLSEDSYFEFNKYCVKQDNGERLINPFNLDVNDISTNDIIVALSGINRFAGQTKLLHKNKTDNFYTVGQHTLAMYEFIKSKEAIELGFIESEAEANQLAKIALLHEGFEGITGTDLITPFKYATKKNEYKIAENDAENVMEKIFDMPLMTSKLKTIDKAMATTEGYYLVGQSNTNWKNWGQLLNKEVLKTNMSQKEVQVKLQELYEKEGLNELLSSYKKEFNLKKASDFIFDAKIKKMDSILNDLTYTTPQKEILYSLKADKISKEDNHLHIVLNNLIEVDVTQEGLLIKQDDSREAIFIQKNDFKNEVGLNKIIKLDSSFQEVSESVCGIQNIVYIEDINTLSMNELKRFCDEVIKKDMNREIYVEKDTQNTMQEVNKGIELNSLRGLPP